MQGPGRAWLPKLLLMATLLHCQHASWIDDTSTLLAQRTLSATMVFLNSSACGAACTCMQAGASMLEGIQRDVAVSVLTQQMPSFATSGASNSTKAQVRVQLDMFALGVQTVADIAAYNEEAHDHVVDMIPTPKWRSSADVMYTSVSIPADARLTDLTGTGTESIAPTSPSHQIGQPWFVFYRRDVFAAAQIAPPETMDDILSAAHQLNGTDFDGDGAADHSVCFNADPGCVTSYFTFLGILGPMLQTAPSQGVFFQPDTMEPLVRNAAMTEALRIYADLASCNYPGSLDQACNGISSHFVAGSCAITFGVAVFRASNRGWANVTGNIGTGMFPGATRVLDRTSNTLQPCTKELCPLAVASSQTKQLVNFAPLYTVYRIQMLLASAISGETIAATQSLGTFLNTRVPTRFITPLLKALGLIRPATNASAANHPSPPASSAGSTLNPEPLVAIGYNVNDTTSFLPAALSGMTHSNQLQDIALPGAAYFRSAIAEAAANATLPGADLGAITTELDAYYRMVAHSFPRPADYQRLYWSMIGYVPTTGGSAGSKDAASSGGGGVHWQGGFTAAVVAPVAALLAALLLTWIYTQSRASRRTLLGAVAPPGVGRSTTLLVTDIQNSTVMWEKLPMGLMAQVLRVHHSTLRSLLDKHNGYESTTEGDSFILAFHSPSDALAYAIEAQQCLLAAAWPPELLSDFEEARTIIAAPCRNADVDLSYKVKKLQAKFVAAGKRFSSASRMDFALMNASRGTNSGRRSWWRCLVRVSTPLDVPQVPSMPDELDPEDFGADANFTNIRQLASSSFGWSLSQAWSQVRIDPTSTVQQAGFCVWRGLRVRMGIHSSLSNPMHVTYNKASHRTQYSGDFASTAKAVGDAGNGGQIVLSGGAFAQLSAKDRSRGLCVMLMGEHVLKEGQAAQPLYQAVVPGLEPRLESFPPLRTREVVQDGVQQAPVGTATIVFMNAVGVSTLMGWNAEVAQQSVQLYHKVVSALLPKYLGYVVEMADGLCLAAFQRPEQAIAWALACQAELIDASWPEALLRHELCEVITTTVAVSAKQGNGQVMVDTVSQISSRGLRLKVGIDVGRVMDSVHPATGRMAYRGKVMNRAARISATATSGQVLAAPVAWQLASTSTAVQAAGIIATSAGSHSLKGVATSMELFSCTTILRPDAEDGSSVRRGYLCSSLMLKTGQDIMSSLMSDHRHPGRQFSWGHSCLDSTMELEPSHIASAPDCDPSPQDPPTSGGPQEPLAPEGARLE